MYLYYIAKTFSVIHTNFESRLFQILQYIQIDEYCNVDNGIFLQFNILPVILKTFLRKGTKNTSEFDKN